MDQARLPTWRGTRPLKRWRYVAVFCEELMACAARVQVGPAHQSFWALWWREEGRLDERTRLLRRGAVRLEPGRLRVRDGAVELDLALVEDAWIEARCPHGTGHVWTRKQAGIPAHGTVRRNGGPARTLEALAVVDDTAGYHARVTEWWWAAGVGEDPAGTPLAFNLVEGVNDPPTEAGRHSPSARIPVSSSSERAVWVAGAPYEVPPVRFARDLSRIDGADGERLDFVAEAERHRRERLLVVSSEYRAPFGTFSGTLPGGVQLVRGMGVMEHHRARW